MKPAARPLPWGTEGPPDGATILASITVTLLIVLGFWIGDDRFGHWFLLPIFACGVVIGVDMIDWARGRLNIYDPIGIMGMLGYHFFFLSFLLHVSWNYWLTQVVPPPDWRDWLGAMALINLFGLLIYRLTRVAFAELPANHKLRYQTRRIRPRAFFPLLAVALLISGALQLAAYAKFGGIMGYIAAYEAREGAFEDMGWVFMLSERFPILALMGFAVYARARRMKLTNARIAALLVTYLLVTFLFGGLRGSRSNTIWSLFWAAGIVHFWLRPLPKKLVGAGLAFLAVFMYIYGFYKSGGSEAVITVLQDRSQIEAVEQNTGRGSEVVILSDLARADIQAFLLYRMFHSDYQVALGRTYIGAAALLIPKSLWENRPMHKIREGTQAQYGMREARAGGHRSSRVYGLSGEFMLNFGPALVPLVFTVIGFVVGRTRRLMRSMARFDARWLLVPFLINLCFVVLGMDSDNVLFFLIKNGLFPVLVVYLGSEVVSRQQHVRESAPANRG